MDVKHRGSALGAVIVVLLPLFNAGPAAQQTFAAAPQNGLLHVICNLYKT